MPDKHVFLRPGDRINFTAVSPLYREKYEAEVMAVRDSTLFISMPLSQGKLVLLSTGTPLEVTCPYGRFSFASEVLKRDFQPSPHLVLQLPYYLSAKKNRARVITVTSGKGGVGKTTFTINFAINLAQKGYRVFVMDADLGTANIDVLLNMQPKYNLNHVINREKELLDVVVEGPGGFHLIPGGSGVLNLADMEEWQFNRLISGLQSLEDYADIILIDTGAGLGKNVINFALAADNIIIITTPEPHSITDAYAVVKVLNQQNKNLVPYLVLNRVESAKEYRAVASKIEQVIYRFLGMKISPLGYVLDDPVVPKANRRLEPFSLSHPSSSAARCLQALTDKFVQPEQPLSSSFSELGFFNRLKELFK